jgi:hypothetical protein
LLVLPVVSGHKKTGIFPGGKGKCWEGFGKIIFTGKDRKLRIKNKE